MASGWVTAAKAAGAVVRAANSVSKAVVQSGSSAVQARGARRGVLVPGDPAPPPTRGGSAFFDYRGTASPSQITASLRGDGFDVGHLLNLKRGSVGAKAKLPVAAICEHIAIVGRTAAGKTTSFIVPWITNAINLGFTVIAVDVKGDLFSKIDRTRWPDTVVASEIDYRNPATSTHWNWVREVDNERGIENACASILGRRAPPGTDPHFYDQDARHLRALLEWSSMGRIRLPMSTAALIVRLGDQEGIRRFVALNPRSSPARGLADLVELDAEEFSKTISGVVAKLDPLARSSIEEISKRATFRTDQLLRGHHFVSFVAPLGDGRMSETFSSLFVNQLLHRLYDRFGRLDNRPILLVLDEAARLSDRVDFAALLSIARSAGISVVFAVQDVAQFKDDGDRATIFANCGSLIVMKGSSSGSAALLSSRLGSYAAEAVSRSAAPGVGFRGSLSSSYVNVPVLGEREIMTPPFGDRPAVVHARAVSDKPFLVELSNEPI